jgi:hypothetical protein
MREAGALSTQGVAMKLQHTMWRGVLCLPTGGNHVCTTRGLKLLISIAVSLENTNRPQPESPGPVGEKIRSGRRGDAPTRS